MSDIFDVESLFRHYSKAIIKERKVTSLDEKESITKFNPTDFQKFKAVLYYDDDPTMLPASFQVDYIYSIVFNIKSIIQNFSNEEIDFDSDINIDDDEIDKMVMKKMKGGGDRRGRKSVVDIETFYNTFFKKTFPSYVLSTKMNDLIRAGIIPIENWKIYAITYSTQVDDKLLFRKVETGLKKGITFVPSPFGYQIAFESANPKQTYSQEEVIEFTTRFSKAFEKAILQDTKYYKIVRK